jgi:hypothetical protein
MRSAFGLVGILVGIGVLVWLMGKSYLPYTQQVLRSGQSAESQVQQLAGRDENMRNVAESAELEVQHNSSGQPASILVLSVVERGAYERFWGLKRNDSIVSIGPLSVRDAATSNSAARDFVQEAYQRSQSLTVIRDGQKLTLEPRSGESSGSKPSDPLQQQLDAIQRIPGH